MKIILLKTIQKLGNKGEIIEVSAGFATNFLIPKDIAVAATPQALANLTKQKKDHKDSLKEMASHWLEIKKEIESKEIIEFRNSKNDILVGNISRKHVLEILSANLSVKIDKKQVPKDYIYGMGINRVLLTLYPNITAEAKIIIKEKK